jgi:hypothetical protein
MMILGFRVPYDGQFGNANVIQCGKFKIIQVKDYSSVPLPLAYLLMRAKDAEAEFLVIDPDASLLEDKSNWFDTRIGEAA